MNKRISGRFFSIIFLFSVLPLAASEEGKHLFILSGQSNMRKPLPDTFRKCVSGVFGEDKVLVSTVARASQPIKRWYKGWAPPAGMDADPDEVYGDLYDKLIANVKKGIRGAPLASVTYVWMQGEADAGKGWGSVYEKSFLGVLEQIKEDLDINEINFVVGRINEYWLNPSQFPDGKMIRELQVKLGETHANGAWVNTDDLNRGVNPWGGYSLNDGHFPPSGYRVMGQRFAKAACLLIDPNLDLDENLFREVFFDSIDDVKSHAAIGKSVKSAGTGAGLKAADFAKLTDGKYGSKRHSDSEWLMIKASKKPVELVVDLGEVQQVDLVGVHTLFSSEAEAEYPDSLQFQFSEDGESFQLSNSKHNNTQLNKNDRQLIKDTAEGEECLLVLTEQLEHRSPEPGVSARYVKVLIQTGTQNVLIDEIIVNPVGVSESGR